MPVIERAPAKINLALHIIGRRSDGYHDLDSVVAFADVADDLVIEPADQTSLAITGPFAPALPRDGDNIILKAWALLGELAAERRLPFGPAAFHLTKNLPVAAGIGGGSTDAAASLRGLIRLFGLVVEPQELQRLALRLGADVPVCLHPGRYHMQGIGERLAPLPGPLPPAIVLVNPGVQVATADVFRRMALQPGQAHRTAIANLQSDATWRNDMTEAACALEPGIATVLESLRASPGIGSPRMSGSGATCFACAPSLAVAEAAAARLRAANPAWWTIAANLL